MASSSSSSSVSPSAQTAADPKNDLRKKIRGHEVAIAELNNLSSSRAIYQRNGTIYFRTSIKAATSSEQSKHSFKAYDIHFSILTSSEQKQLDLAKSQLQKLSSA
ncbi:Prefoldin chaperone subunit family protein [Cinnamomum micranthum f. kanehirae]|uniref:Prefoldin chaperone subunit family protein n=1 Tax=Cinnamomum micranthum f. kanehirae TaxID=337451 RepID=A0A443P913_9MAGN|nr:Prefoldin chaperone subunit family protein [Cinnamomum micranthum f. kanehirae]